MGNYHRTDRQTNGETDERTDKIRSAAIQCNTVQYNRKFALKNRQTNCQFNLAHKLKRTEMFEKNEMRDTENKNTVE